MSSETAYAMLMLSVLFTLISVSEICDSARILGVVSTPSYSHQIIFRPIWRELAKRGHDLVVITTDPENDPSLSITEIDISFAYDLWTKKHDVVKIISKNKYNPITMYKLVMDIMFDISTQELEHPGVHKLLKNDTEHFDLVVVEYLYPVMLGFAARFNCPYIGVVTSDLPTLYHDMLGNPVHPVLYPDLALGLAGKLIFWERMFSTLMSWLQLIIMGVVGGFDTSRERQLMEDHFGKKVSSTYDVLKNVSMVFINENPAFNLRPLGPAFVSIGGGMQMQEAKTLPKVKIWSI